MVESTNLREEMNISKYDFHDGYLIDMKQINNNIEIVMESAEIWEEDLQDNIIVSEHNTIKGKLHLEKIKNLKINDKIVNEVFVKKYDRGDIFSFDIEGNTATLVLSWENCHPHPYERTDFFTIEIEAEKIWWENIPDLINPYW